MNFNINATTVGANEPVFIIAEACDNHMGDLKVAKEMARLSKLAGASAVKFQHHLPEEEMLEDIPMSDNFDEPLFQFLKKNALTLSEHVELKNFCDDIGITYLCTPFSWAAAIQLHELDLPAYKIGSGEMTDIPYLKKMIDLGRPLIISTGMSDISEITRTYNLLDQGGIPFALLNCTSEYPPVYEDINLLFINEMINLFPNATIGHSDHTPDLFTCFGAVVAGAKIIEKHVIIDKTTPGPDQSVSINFSELTELVDGIRKIEKALGSSKKVHSHENQIREWATRSVVSTKSIKKGSVIEPDMVWSKRPGTGIPSHLIDDVIGKKALVDINQNILIDWSMLKE